MRVVVVRGGNAAVRGAPSGAGDESRVPPTLSDIRDRRGCTRRVRVRRGPEVPGPVRRHAGDPAACETVLNPSTVRCASQHPAGLRSNKNRVVRGQYGHDRRLLRPQELPTSIRDRRITGDRWGGGTSARDRGDDEEGERAAEPHLTRERPLGSARRLAARLSLRRTGASATCAHLRPPGLEMPVPERRRSRRLWQHLKAREVGRGVKPEVD